MAGREGGGPGACSPGKIEFFENLRNTILGILVEFAHYYKIR